MIRDDLKARDATVEATLLEAVKLLLPLAISDCQQWSRQDPETHEEIVFARAAIAKAEGM